MSRDLSVSLQSNMEYSINGSNGAIIKHPPINDSNSEITTMKRSEYSAIRLIRAGHRTSTGPSLELPPPAQGGETYAPVLGWTHPCPTIDGEVTCRVDMSALCWLFGRNIFNGLADRGTPRPIGMIESCWSGSPDEAWSTADGLKQCGLPGKANGGMYQGMIRPLLNTTIKGAIW